MPKFSLFHFSIVFTLLISSVCAQETFRDNFSAVSYANNDGTRNFSANWQENEATTSPSAGQIQIVGNRLRFQQMTGQVILRNLDLSGVATATLTFTYEGTGIGDEVLSLFFRRNDGNLIILQNYGNGAGTATFNIPAAYIHANSAIGFFGNTWNVGETAFVDNLQIAATISPPTINVSDVTVDEDAGTANFIVNHIGTNASGPFTVNYETLDGTAVAGDDFTFTTGTLNFNGTVGDQETISVPIIDDISPEALTERFSLVFTGTSDTSVDITDTAIGSINDDDIVNNAPLVLREQFNGYFDYAVTGGSLRDDTVNNCFINPTSSNTFQTNIPVGAVVERALLYWTHSSTVLDDQVNFEGQPIVADNIYAANFVGLQYYGYVSDVTSILSNIPDLETNVFDFSGLTVDNSATYCPNLVVGGWSLKVFFTEPSLPAVSINLYEGFSGERNSASSFTLDGFFAIGTANAKTTITSWEGDVSLTNNELISVTTTSGTFGLNGDGDNDGLTVNNPFNSTFFDNTVVPIINNSDFFGVDIDTHNISPFIQPGESAVTVNIQSGDDTVIINSLVIKVPSNLITGRVFEDLTYGGGTGRDLVTAQGIGTEGTTVELYDNTGVLLQTDITDANGDYVFAGMENGDFSVRVVNSSVRSSRGGGTGCINCIPIQTFRRNYANVSGFEDVENEIGGVSPSSQDSSSGVLVGAQTVSAINIIGEGVVGVDFGFNFNTIVNTNGSGQGSLAQFIVNSNNLDETGLDIDPNGIFDPEVGEDLSVFMIPPTNDALGRTADSNFNGTYFDIFIQNSVPLPAILDQNTHIDGRTQTAYSGDSNAGSIGAGGTAVGTSGTILPNYELPEIQIHRNGGEVLIVESDDVVIRNVSVFANNNASIRINNGSVAILENLLAVNAIGGNAGNVDFGIENQGGDIQVARNYIATASDAGIVLNGGNSSIIENNHIWSNGATACDDNIQINSGAGIIIRQNLIEDSASLGIDAENIAGEVAILDNTITGSGQNGGDCSGNIENYGIRLSGNDSEINNNIIFDNGGAGLVLVGNSGENGNLISQNSFFNNGTAGAALGIDLVSSGIVADGVTINDLNDGDSGPNDLINFPIIESAKRNGNSLRVSGWVGAGATVEFFLTDISQGTASKGDNELGLSTDYGEGQLFIASFDEGSPEDNNANTASYSDADNNTDTTNRFEFIINLPSGLAVLGDGLTATATITNSTSEFSPLSNITAFTVITNRRITYRVKKQ